MEPTALTADAPMADTICAVSTPPGRGGIAVVRVSGPQAIDVCSHLWRGAFLAQLPSHTARYGLLCDAAGTELDHGVVTIFRAPGSYTGEDTVEISVHGSTYIQRELLKALVDTGARMALPGEFTRRAFVNGRLDLAQAEAVADVIAADTAAQHRLAQAQLKGAFSDRITALHDRLVELASLLELELDFSEEDVEFAPRHTLIALGEEIIDEIDHLTRSYSTGAAIKEGVPVAIVGSPNAGKSTLLNQLLADDRAIVSDIPGTTRDTIEGTAMIDGTLFRFIDTAGLRHTTDTVESIGIDRAIAKARDAAIIIWLIDPTATAEATADVEARITTLLTSPGISQGEHTSHPALITLIGKQDLLASNTTRERPGTPILRLSRTHSDSSPLLFSSKRPETLTALTRRLSQIAQEKYTPGDVTVTNVRHYESLRAARTTTLEVLSGLRDGLPPELIAQSLRATLRHLASITGSITTPTLLHTIFTRFCIGK